ncbi:MAG: alkaline phosphatase D family protein [Bdellovibrionales bacterium]|nr:alkaline phosphatase D family protein [Bdellovibrionales bacterium]
MKCDYWFFKVLMSLVLFTSWRSYAGPNDIDFVLGARPMIQGATSESETQFNVLIPRLKLKSTVAVVVERGQPLPQDIQGFKAFKKFISPQESHIFQDKLKLAHWGVKKFKFKGLKINKKYLLVVFELGKYFKKVDQREFEMVDLSRKTFKLALGSCMSDDFSFEGIRKSIWSQVEKQKPDLLILSGDVVYVDSFDFVARNSATDLDIWLRYINTMRVTPLYSLKKLIPVLATWDDHDMVTNNSHKDTKNKEAALRAFQVFFGSEPIDRVYKKGKTGVMSVFKTKSQSIYLMDGRFFREEPFIAKTTGEVLNDKKDYYDKKNKKKHVKLGAYSAWGQHQHQWLINELIKEPQPSWIVNGFQFFGNAFISKTKAKNGSVKVKRVNESIQDDHSEHFGNIVRDLKKVPTPVAFMSGDIHASEVLKIEKEKLGYETLEVTSSPVHSYIYGAVDELFPNKRRIMGKKDYNVIFVESTAQEQGLTVTLKAVNYLGKTLFSLKDFKIQK